VNATWVAANGVEGKWDPSAWGELKGADQAAAGCVLPAINPVRVAVGEAPTDLSLYTTSGLTPVALESGTPLDVANSTGINWSAVLAGAITPDYATVQLDNWDYTVQMLTGTGTLGVPGESHTGTGLLIVTDDLQVLGSFVQWYGVILVGGRIIFDAADQRFDGWVVTGLNEQIGTGVVHTDLGSFANYIDIDFNSTYVYMGMQGLSGWVPVENAWMDNWASY
jgi:hypothetical protein